MFLMSFYRSEVSTHKDCVHLLCNFRFCVKFFAYRRSEESITALMQMLVWRNNNEDGHCPSPGLYTTISSVHYQKLAQLFLTGSSVIININNTKISCL
jgi:hypothetical protein